MTITKEKTAELISSEGKNKDDSGVAGIKNGYGIMYKNWGRYEQAIKYFEEALQIRVQEKNLQEEAKVLNGLAQCHVQVGNNDISFEYYNRSLKIRRKIDDKPGLAAILSNMSLNYRRIADYAKAMKYSEEAIELFEELDIPLTTVSTDIVNNVKIESKSGDLINAIRASIAVPGVLTPTYVNDNLCVDGGLIDPVPLQSIIDMGSKQTIAVNLYGLQNSKKNDNKYNIVDIVDRSAKIMLNNVTHLSFKNNEPNILIEPPIDQFYGWDFHKANELINIGYDTAKEILNDNSELFI